MIPTRTLRATPPPRPLALIAFALALAGCGQDAGVLARVNQQTITREQFEEVAAGNLGQYAGPPDTVKARLLKDLVDRELLVQGALGEGLDRTPQFQIFRRTVEQQALREALFQKLLGGPFPVSDAEVRALYDRRGTATRVRLIFSFDEPQVRLAARDIARGDSFTTVADRYNPTGMVPPGGDVGFVQPGTLLPPLDDMVRNGTPGQILGPVAAGSDGWFLVRIEERRSQPQPPFEEERARLGEMLRQRKQRVIANRVVERLRAEYHIEIQPGAAQFMIEKLRPVPGEGMMQSPPAPPGPEDRARVLGRYLGGTYTLGEAYDDLSSGAAGRLDFAVVPSVERWLRSQVLERAALLDARKRRLDEEPTVQRRVRERLNNTLLDGFYQRHVIGEIRLEPGDLEAAYQRHQASFVRLRSARVVSITLADSAAAATLAARVVTAPSLREAAATAAPGVPVSEERLAFPAESPLWTQFETHLTAIQPGQSVGPFRTPSGWLIFQLLEKQQGAPPFESLNAGARAQLQSVALELKREARLAALTDSLRRAFAPIVIYSDRLRRIPWPPVAAPTGT